LGKSAKNVAIEDGYIGGYGIDQASLLEGDDFELVGKCIFVYWGLMGFVWAILIITVIITVPQISLILV
jgi:hypothetical protein